MELGQRDLSGVDPIGQIAAGQRLRPGNQRIQAACDGTGGPAAEQKYRQPQCRQPTRKQPSRQVQHRLYHRLQHSRLHLEHHQLDPPAVGCQQQGRNIVPILSLQQGSAAHHLGHHAHPAAPPHPVGQPLVGRTADWFPTQPNRLLDTVKQNPAVGLCHQQNTDILRTGLAVQKVKKAARTLGVGGHSQAGKVAARQRDRRQQPFGHPLQHGLGAQRRLQRQQKQNGHPQHSYRHHHVGEEQSILQRVEQTTQNTLHHRLHWPVGLWPHQPIADSPDRL